MSFPRELLDMPFWIASLFFHIGNYSVNCFRVELESLPPYEFLDIFFSERWLLEIEAERRWADGFIVYLVKGCQVWMAQSLVNCNATEQNKQDYARLQDYQ